jgi:hypothetical protein
MARIFHLVLFAALLITTPAYAIGNVTGGTNLSNYTYSYNTSTPAAPGWNYVGQLNGASGTYLGNGWVLTAAHIGGGSFTLNGTVYAFVSGSVHTFTDSNGMADLTLFQISPRPNLPPLVLATSPPTELSSSGLGSSVTMIGFGGNGQRTWGDDTITYTNQLITPENTSYVSNDFLTITGSYTEGSVTSSNSAQVIVGDSGGGDFIYNPTSGQWELAGINEVNGTATINGSDYTVSGMVQLSTYATQINAIFNPPPSPTDTPALPPAALLVLAILLCGLASSSLAVKTSSPHRLNL